MSALTPPRRRVFWGEQSTKFARRLCSGPRTEAGSGYGAHPGSGSGGEGKGGRIGGREGGGWGSRDEITGSCQLSHSYIQSL